MRPHAIGNPATSGLCEGGKRMLLPIGRAEERAGLTASVVYLLIIANVLLFLMELVGGDYFISAYSVVPWEITHGEDLTGSFYLHGDWIILPARPLRTLRHCEKLSSHCLVSRKVAKSQSRILAVNGLSSKRDAGSLFTQRWPSVTDRLLLNLLPSS